ncbi:hypothetical protein C8F01DRAFT_1276356 [Mycena amicta]|nr:hypothetical protein C8F01DRAFT_1276356 [Mycena amicta]
MALDDSSLAPLTEEHPTLRHGGHLSSALRAVNAVYPVLLNLINCLSAFPAPPRPERSIVGLCGIQLLQLIQEEADIARAIQAGVVRTLAHIHSGAGLEDGFEMIFDLILKPLDDHAGWVAFVEKTAERMRLLAQLDDCKNNESSPALATWRTKACDNVECNKIQERSAFGRCPCGSVYYCSSTCQIADWHGADGHRSVCGTRWLFLLSDFMIPRIPFKQRCFLRQLIHADYLQNFDKICRLQAEFIASLDSESDSTPATADPPLCITWFDYAYRTDVEITILDPDSDLISHLRSGAEAEWNHILLRARKSRGTIAIHVLSLTQLSSEASRFVIIPLRISASAARKLAQLYERQCESEAEFSLFSAMLEGADEGIFGIH